MKNNAKTVILLAGLIGLLVVIGGAVGGRGGATIGLIFGLVMNMGAYWFSDKIALRMSRARPVSQAEAPELYAIVGNLTQAAGLPMPSLHMIPSEQPNAFATGRNPEHAAVAVTEGIMKVLSRDELTAVLAHELGHVRNRDILISSVAAAVAGAISWVAFMLRWTALFGGDDDDNPAGLGGALLIAIIAPIAALVIQLAISRSREYEADQSGARLTGMPENLASALQKIDAHAKQIPLPVNPSASPLFIINPLSGGGMVRLFSTHPSTEERVRRLMAMVGR